MRTVTMADAGSFFGLGLLVRARDRAWHLVSKERDSDALYFVARLCVVRHANRRAGILRIRECLGRLRRVEFPRLSDGTVQIHRRNKPSAVDRATELDAYDLCHNSDVLICCPVRILQSRDSKFGDFPDCASHRDRSVILWVETFRVSCSFLHWPALRGPFFCHSTGQIGGIPGRCSILAGEDCS